MRHKGAEHPRRDFAEFAEEALHSMAKRNIIDLLILENGFLAACIKSSKPRTAEIDAGKKRYEEAKVMREAETKDRIEMLNRCLQKSA